MAFTPPGWQLIAGDKARRAINPQGEVVSRRAYLDAQARQSGFASYREFTNQSKSISQFRNTPEGKKLLQLGSPDLKEFKVTILSPAHKQDTSPGGRLATMLEKLGLREKDAKYSVGDTPGAD